MNHPVDLRSDTVTRPSAAMREAIANAPVGDDVFGDDPTVLELQHYAARLLGKEASLFVPSGSMANQIALLCYCRPGDHVIVPSGAHVVHYEAGGGGAIAGVQFCELGSHGTYELEALSEAFQPDDHHHPPTRLVTLENTHNRGGGAVVTLEHMQAVRALVHARGLPLHLDGARLFHAVAAGLELQAATAAVDSLSICLSKGLGAPIGSLLAGTRPFIHQAHRYRKMLGGAMRQVGILAAAGLYALQHNVERLGEDHRRARQLAVGIAELPGVHVDLARVETNIVYFELGPEARLTTGADFERHAASLGLLCHASARRTVRWVTHLDLDDDGVDRALAVARRILAD